MKKLSIALITLLISQASLAVCLQKDNSPVPFPFKIEIFQKYERNWLFTQNRELSIRFARTQTNRYSYYLINFITEMKSRGQLVLQNNQLCALQSSTPFCIYNDKENLRIAFEYGLVCKDSELSIIGFTR